MSRLQDDDKSIKLQSRQPRNLWRPLEATALIWGIDLHRNRFHLDYFHPSGRKPTPLFDSLYCREWRILGPGNAARALGCDTVPSTNQLMSSARLHVTFVFRSASFHLWVTSCLGHYQGREMGRPFSSKESGPLRIRCQCSKARHLVLTLVPARHHNYRRYREGHDKISAGGPLSQRNCSAKDAAQSSFPFQHPPLNLRPA